MKGLGSKEKDWFSLDEVVSLTIEYGLLALLVIIFFCFIFFKDQGYAKITLICSLAIALSILIKEPLLKVNGVKYFWYFFWSAFGLLQFYIVFALYKNEARFKFIIKVLFISATLNLLVSFVRFVERFYFDTGYTKTLYSAGVLFSGYILCAGLIYPLYLYFKEHKKYQKGFKNG